MVTLILTRIVFVLSIPLCLYAVYFGVVALFGLRKKLPAAPQAKPEKRFALVVAARNEAAVIGHLAVSYTHLVIMLASSERISPNMFSVTITSNWDGSFTICMDALSTYI